MKYFYQKIKLKLIEDEDKIYEKIHNQTSDTLNKKDSRSLLFHLELNAYQNKNKDQSFILIGEKSRNESFKVIIFKQIKDLFSIAPNSEHSFKLSILNISLGIQFFSMINVFPHLSNNCYFFSNLVDEIFYSKFIHTIFLSFLPLILLCRYSTRKAIMYITLFLNLSLNCFILLGIFNAILVVHIFRFLWNVSYININLYSAEAINSKYRNINTSFMYLLFKMSCLVEILTIDSLINISIYIPIAFNIFLLVLDILITRSIILQPHFMNLKEIDAYFVRKEDN